MPLTIQQKINQLKQKRSDAINQKISTLLSRDGSDIPKIDSLKDEDEFNCKMLWGTSGNESINYDNALGIEGIISLYYKILQYINGTERTKIITNSGISPTSLERAAYYLINGQASNSDFFIDDQGNFDLLSEVLNQGATALSYNDNITQNIQDLITLLGQKSDLGEKIEITSDAWLNYVHDSLLGKRFTDVRPYSEVPLPDSSIAYHFGNGVYDKDDDNTVNYPPGFTDEEYTDFWDTNLNTLLNDLINKIDNIINWLNKTLINDFTYLPNQNIIFDYTNNYNTINNWINQFTSYKDDLVSYYNVLNTYTDTSTPSEDRDIINTNLENLKTTIQNIDSLNTTIVNTLNNYFGSASNIGSAFGNRFLWVKTIIDQSDGSKVKIQGISKAVEYSNKNINKCETELINVYGINTNEFIPTPEISDIEYYFELNTTTLELEKTGMIIAWNGQNHCTAYDIWKSYDYDPNTGSGNWQKILPSGQSHTIINIDTNTGKVVTYYIDKEIDINNNEKPYYKIQAFDDGGSGDYTRLSASSLLSNPKNIDDFQQGSSGVTITPQTAPVEKPETPDNVNDYYKYETYLSGSNYINIEHTQYKSSIPFDSLGTNLMVYKNHQLMQLGVDYNIIGNDIIEFTTPPDNSDQIIIIVFIYKNETEGSAATWKSPVNNLGDLPTSNNTDGDIRLVTSLQQLFIWDNNVKNWFPLKALLSQYPTHSDLLDMPDDYGTNTDHDTRYYPRDELNPIIDNINSDLEKVKLLIPEKPLNLSGDLEPDSNINFYTGYISLGTQIMTLEPLKQFDKIIKTDDLILYTPDNQIADADKGIIYLYLNDIEIDSINLENLFNESENTHEQSYCPYTSTYLTILSVKPYNEYIDYQIGKIKINIPNNLLQSGENQIYLAHNVSGTNYYSNKFIIFKDDNVIDSYIVSNSIFENSISSHKFLSGIEFFTLNDSLMVNLNINYVFNNSYLYPDTIKIISDISNDIIYNHHSENIFDTNPEIDTDFKIRDIYTITKSNIFLSELKFKAMIYKPDRTITTFSDNFNVLINTYNNYSTDLIEYFVDEIYRLPYNNYDNILTNIKNLFQSDQTLGTNDLQVFGQLQYPRGNYTLYLPVQTKNYDNFENTRYYIRGFTHFQTHTNGNFIIEGYNNDPNTGIWIKLPGITGWLDLTKYYDESTFQGIDDDGCLISKSGDSYKFTLGGFSTHQSNYIILIKISMNKNSNPITKLQLIY